MYSLPEILTENFYLWEYRGRGWAIYDLPVELEPPFVPFSRVGVALPKVIDDGRRPTLASSLIEKVKEKFGNEPEAGRQLALPKPPEYEFPPEPYVGEPSVAHLKLVSPPGSDIPLMSVEHLLLSLSYLDHPLSFEIVGEEGCIIVQITCTASEADLVQREIKAYFPEAGVVASRSDRCEVPVIIGGLEESATSAAVVDFGLSEEFMRPIKTFKNLSLDPLTGVYAALDNLFLGEAGVFQVLFKATKNPWSESVIRSVTDYDGSPFFLDAPEMLPLAKEKTGSALYAAVIRVLGLGRTEDRAWEIARSLASPMRTFARPESNELTPLNDEGYGPGDHLKDFFMRVTRRGGMILNVEELAGLMHPPSSSVASEKLSRLAVKTRPAPASMTAEGVVLGENVHQEHTLAITLSSEQRLKHVHVVGATGTGKSTLLLNLIVQDMERGNGIAVLDPHGDLIEDVLARIPEKRIEDVVLIDPSDAEYPVGFNVLSAGSEIERNVLSSDLVAIFRRFSTSWGDLMTTVLGNAAEAFVESRMGGTLSDMKRFLIEKEFREEFLETVDDEGVKYFWRREFPLLRGNSHVSIITRLDAFLRSKLVRNIVNQREGISFRDIINRRKILLVKLSHGIIGEENSYTLGAMIVSAVHQAVMARQAVSRGSRENFFLYIDEFQNFITPSLTATITGARKYGVGLTLAHQELRQLYRQDSTLAETVIANAGTRICFRLGDFDAEKLATGFSHFTSRDLQQLSTGEAIARIDRADHDFNLRTFPKTETDAEVGRKTSDEAIGFSRRTYGHAPFRHPTPPLRKWEGTAGEKIGEEEPETWVEDRPKRQEDPPPQAMPRKDTRIPQTQAGAEGAATDRTVTQHRYLQNLIKRLAEDRGYKATIEAPTPDLAGKVDVSLERGNEKVAFEISVTTGAEHEFRNIRKCLDAGYAKVVIATSDKKQADRLYQIAKDNLDTAELARVLIIRPDNIAGFFEVEVQKPQIGEKEKTVKGYRVKVSYPTREDPEEKRKTDTITQTILNSMRRLRKG